jgi:hypothetical protein
MLTKLFQKFQHWLQQRKLNAAWKKYDLLQHISQQFTEIADRIRLSEGDYNEICKQIDGYEVRDVSNEVLLTEWKDEDYITLDEIHQTEGYNQLLTQAQLAGITIQLEDEQSEEVDDEERVSFILHASLS